jgi:hypothetical protein
MMTPKFFSLKSSTYIIMIFVQVIFFNICNGQNKSDKWSKVRSVLMNNSDPSLNDYSSKLKFCNCVIDKLKIKYPNDIDNISQDSLNYWAKIYGANCGYI